MNATRYPYSLTSGMANICEVKKFKSKELLCEFMCKVDNSWKMREDLDLPSGRYKTQIDSKSIRYINVKTERIYTFAR